MSEKAKINPILAKRFKSVRLNANLTQKELAEKLYVTPQMVSYYECGTKRITPQIAHSMGVICGINQDYLLDTEVEYPTQDAQVAAVLSQTSRENILIHRALVSLLELNGHKVAINSIGKGQIQVDEVFRRMKKHLIIDGKKSLSIDETNRLGNAVNDVFVMLLKRYYDIE